MCAWSLLVPLLSALAIIACVPASPQPGEFQSFAGACDKPNEGQLIAVEGFLRLPDSFEGLDTVILRLYPDASFTGKPIGATIYFGSGPNQAELITGSYRDPDLKVHLSNGQLVPFGTKLRVSGRMYYPVVAQDFTCGLQNLYLEAAK